MYYKLTSTCRLVDIEQEFNVTFRYPNLYESKVIVNGLDETSVPILTTDEPNTVNFAIWGLLPEGYADNWQTFQNMTNTLNTKIDNKHLTKDLFAETLYKRRCLIIVNGFITYKLENGKLVPFHIHLENHKPFCLAGIYNHTHDGFLTCSVLISGQKQNTSIAPTLGEYEPLILKKENYNHWLNPNSHAKDIKQLITTHDSYNFISNSMQTMFYKDTKMFKRILKQNSL